MGNIFGGDEGTPVGGIFARIINLFTYQGRGIIGSIIIFIMPILLMPGKHMKTKPAKTVMVVWLLIFSFLLIHPIKVPTVAFIPVFLFPLLHVMNSANVCKMFFSQNTALLVVGGYLRDLLNVSGVDKRFTSWIMFSNATAEISNSSLIVKSSIAAYILSMVSNRDRVLHLLMNHVVGPLGLLGSSAAEPDYNKMKRIVGNAVVTSATIGSLAIVNGARNVMFMRILWETSGHEDTFNFIDYFFFAFPASLAMFIVNLIYHIVISAVAHKSQMSSATMSIYRNNVLEARDYISDGISCHEILAIIITIALNVACMTRWGKIMKKITNSFGWAANKLGTTMIPDASPAVFFLVLSAIIPVKCSPFKIFKAKTYNQLPPVKPDPSVMFWKISDKGQHYGYMFLAGSFSALEAGVKVTGVPHLYLQDTFKFITNQDVIVAVLIMCLLAIILSNTMTSVAASGMLNVLALNFIPPTKLKLFSKHYLLILMTGMATSLGHIPHFKNTPSGAHAHSRSYIVEQMPYAAGSIIVCAIVLFAMICFYAPVIFEIKI